MKLLMSLVKSELTIKLVEYLQVDISKIKWEN